MTERRPDPDALLARVKDEEAQARQGKLKVSFGASAGAALRELDLDAALQRRSALVLVDELAHTNAPGSRGA